MNRKRPSALLRVGAWLLLAPLACLGGPHELRLGIVAPSGEEDSASLLLGARMAVAESNEAAPGTVTLEVRGEAGQWGSAGNDAVILITERHVDAIIAPSDGATTHLILQVSGRTQVPVASLCSDSSVTDAGVPWAIRVVPRTDQEAEALFAAARRPDRSAPHWWAVVPTGHAGRAVRRDLERAARSSSVRLDQFVEGGEPKTDVASLVHRIASGAPDGVLIWLPPSQAGTFVSALRAAGYRGCLAGPSPLDSQEFFATAGAAATGVLATGFRADAFSRGRAEQFETQYRRRYGAQPDSSAAMAYDAARVLIETLRRADSRGGSCQFPLVLPIAGATGMLHFDRSGNRTDALQALSFRDGRFAPLSPKDP